MKVEIKTNDKGYCDYFMINGIKYGAGIYELDIKIRSCGKPEIIIKAISDEFILDSENAKLYLEKTENKESEKK